MAGPSLPYFDLIFSERGRGGTSAALFERFVHWGYWERPSEAAGTEGDFLSAMERLNGLLLSAGRISDGQRVLDAGCGFGGTLASIDRLRKNMRLVGLNIDGRQLAAARKVLRPSKTNELSLVRADACALPFADSSFDRVLAVECIFHFPSRVKFLKEAYRVLRPGGILALSDFVSPWGWGGGGLGWVEAKVARAYGSLGERPTTDYRGMARQAGLEVLMDRDITANTMPTYGFLLDWLERRGSAEARELMQGPTRWLAWLSRLRIVRYRVLSFRRPA